MTRESLRARTQKWLQFHGVRVSKRLGQHFLVNERILERIIEYSQLSKEDVVLEIGTGNGALTQRLAEYAKRIYSIEKDPQLFRILKDELAPHPEITLLEGDAVKITWPDATKLVANLPYNISSPVLFRFFDGTIPMAVLMLQKEFAERLTAKPGSKQYGRLTVMSAYHGSVELLEYISPKCFYPAPAVSSALIRLHLHPQPVFQVQDIQLFTELTTALFGQRRKKIRTPLKAFLNSLSILPVTQNQILNSIPWLDQRVEDLTPQEIAKIANTIFEEQIA